MFAHQPYLITLKRKTHEQYFFNKKPLKNVTAKAELSIRAYNETVKYSMSQLFAPIIILLINNQKDIKLMYQRKEVLKPCKSEGGEKKAT